MGIYTVGRRPGILRAGLAQYVTTDGQFVRTRETHAWRLTDRPTQWFIGHMMALDWGELKAFHFFSCLHAGSMSDSPPAGWHPSPNEAGAGAEK